MCVNIVKQQRHRCIFWHNDEMMSVTFSLLPYFPQCLFLHYSLNTKGRGEPGSWGLKVWHWYQFSQQRLSVCWLSPLLIKAGAFFPCCLWAKLSKSSEWRNGRGTRGKASAPTPGHFSLSGSSSALRWSWPPCTPLGLAGKRSCLSSN